MRFAITIQRPPHVHFYRHVIEALETAGHETRVFVRDSEITTALLDAFDIEYTTLADTAGGSMASLAATQATFEARLLRQLAAFRPDVVTGIGGISASHAATIVGARSVVFTDTEHARLSNALTRPFADAIYTPDCFHRDFGDAHVRYPGYHELAYLHPNRFEPDPGAFDVAGVDPDDPFVIVRLTDWDAAHDVGASGLSDPTDVVERLEDAGVQVLLTSEISLSSGLDARRLDIPPEDIHHLLAYADLYLGEGATMAAESAILGTPAIYVNTLRMGYTDELEARYGLLYNFQGAFRHQQAIETAERILNGSEDRDYEDRRGRLLAEKTDTHRSVLEALGAEAMPA